MGNTPSSFRSHLTSTHSSTRSSSLLASKPPHLCSRTQVGAHEWNMTNETLIKQLKVSDSSHLIQIRVLTLAAVLHPILHILRRNLLPKGRHQPPKAYEDSVQKAHATYRSIFGMLPFGATTYFTSGLPCPSYFHATQSQSHGTSARKISSVLPL